MKVDYRKELERAAHQMILIHDADILNRLILRTIMRNIKIEHSGIFLYDRNRKVYVATVSRGKSGIKVPAGFAKIDRTNPIIRYFTEGDKKIRDNNFLVYNEVASALKKKKVKTDPGRKSFYEDLKLQMSFVKAYACIAGFFRDQLVGILFLGKKKNKAKFGAEEMSFMSVLASDVVMAIQNAWLFEDLKAQSDRNKSLFLNTVRALAQAIEAKDRYTSGHTERVHFYSLVLMYEIKKIRKIPLKKWKNLNEQLRIAALLHDIGKIGVPEKILNKKGRLLPEEMEEIKKHPGLGVEIMRPVKEFYAALEGVKHHHERYDGTGYPGRIKGRKIPLLAAIIAVADSFDAMTTERPYRKALSRTEAYEEIVRENGKQFSPLVVTAFKKAFRNRRL